jgi:anti-sigma B factor antagonist
MQAQIFNAIVQLKLDTAIIELHGEINASAENGLLQACQISVDSGASNIALDFSKVSYINSTGIALIVQLLAKARQAKRRVIGYGLSSHYMEIFKITRLSDYIDLSSDASNVTGSTN